MRTTSPDGFAIPENGDPNARTAVVAQLGADWDIQQAVNTALRAADTANAAATATVTASATLLGRAYPVPVTTTASSAQAAADNAGNINACLTANGAAYLPPFKGTPIWFSDAIHTLDAGMTLEGTGRYGSTLKQWPGSNLDAGVTNVQWWTNVGVLGSGPTGIRVAKLTVDMNWQDRSGKVAVVHGTGGSTTLTKDSGSTFAAGDVGMKLRVSRPHGPSFFTTVTGGSSSTITVADALPENLTGQTARWYNELNTGLGHGIFLSANHIEYEYLEVIMCRGHGLAIDSVQRDGLTFAGELNDPTIRDCRAEYCGWSNFYLGDMGGVRYGSSHLTDIDIDGFCHATYANLREAPNNDTLYAVSLVLTAPDGTTHNQNGKPVANQNYSACGHHYAIHNASGGMITGTRCDGNYLPNGPFNAVVGNRVKNGYDLRNSSGLSLHHNQAHDYGYAPYDPTDANGLWAGYFLQFNGFRSVEFVANRASTDEDQTHIQTDNPNALWGFNLTDGAAVSATVGAAYIAASDNTSFSRSNTGGNTYGTPVANGFRVRATASGAVIDIGLVNNRHTNCAIPYDQGGSGTIRAQHSNNSWQTAAGTGGLPTAGQWPSNIRVADTNAATDGYDAWISVAGNPPTFTPLSSLYATTTGLVTAAKTSNTARTVSTASDDPDLQVSLTTGFWRIAGVLLAAGNGSGAGGTDIKILPVGPGDCVGVIDIGGLASGAIGTSSGRETRTTVVNSGTQTCGLLDPSTQVAIVIDGYVQIVTGGVFKLQWAQANADATATTVYAGSNLVATKVHA